MHTILRKGSISRRSRAIAVMTASVATLGLVGASPAQATNSSFDLYAPGVTQQHSDAYAHYWALLGWNNRSVTLSRAGLQDGKQNDGRTAHVTITGYNSLGHEIPGAVYDRAALDNGLAVSMDTTISDPNGNAQAIWTLKVECEITFFGQVVQNNTSYVTR